MTYNDLVLSVLPSKNQTGDDENYEPPKENLSLGNDDQSFWGIAAMAAAERGFPNPPSGTAQWLALAQAVFNRQWGRWESDTCGGGLRWQINPTNQGYDYKVGEPYDREGAQGQRIANRLMLEHHLQRTAVLSRCTSGTLHRQLNLRGRIRDHLQVD